MPIMDQFKRGVDKAKFEADRLVRINRVQNEIGNVKREIFSVREKIAAAVIDHHKQGDLLHADLEELCGAIDQFETQIAEKEAQIAAIRAEVLPSTPVPAAPPPSPSGSTNRCPHCGFAAPAGAVFCPNCGKQIPPPPPPVAPAANKCSNCSFGLGAEAAFCPNCGQKVVKPVEPMPAPEPRQCPNCGFVLSNEAAFCPNCGKSVTQAAASEILPAPDQAPVASTAELPSAPVAAAVSVTDGMSQSTDTSEALSAVPEPSAPQLAEASEMPESVSLHCPQCGFGLPAEAAFCTNCGFRLLLPVEGAAAVAAPPPPRMCANCRFELLPEAVFCPNCGQPVARTN